MTCSRARKRRDQGARARTRGCPPDRRRQQAVLDPSLASSVPPPLRGHQYPGPAALPDLHTASTLSPRVLKGGTRAPMLMASRAPGSWPADHPVSRGSPGTLYPCSGMVSLKLDVRPCSVTTGAAGACGLASLTGIVRFCGLTGYRYEGGSAAIDGPPGPAGPGPSGGVGDERGASPYRSRYGVRRCAFDLHCTRPQPVAGGWLESPGPSGWPGGALPRVAGSLPLTGLGPCLASTAWSGQASSVCRAD
jgi:hypothetical protein